MRQKLFGSLVITISMTFLLLFVSLELSSKHYLDSQISSHGVYKRRIPYPYRAALAIASDIDSTTSLKEFLTIQEFLNSKNRTALGTGIGLEIGNSFFPRGDKNHRFALDNAPDGEVIGELIKLGYIDFIHSFNEAKDRKDIQDIVKLFLDNNLSVDVWVNHSNVKNNIGSYKFSLGDNVYSEYYHTDFSINTLGYRFVWTGDVSGIIGQGRPLDLYSFVESLDRDNLISSLYENALKEIAKYILSFAGTRYSSRRYNDLIYPLQLDDGQTVFGFVRSSVSHEGVWKAATASGLADLLREEVLKTLIDREGYMILYTHLGKNEGYPYVPKETQDALRLLEKEFRAGKIYVTTTAKLLKYHANNRYLEWHTSLVGKRKNIIIDSIRDPVRGVFVPVIDDLQGITFYTDDPLNTNMFIRDKKVMDAVRNEADHTGVKSIMIPVKRLATLDDKMIEYKKAGYF